MKILVFITSVFVRVFLAAGFLAVAGAGFLAVAGAGFLALAGAGFLALAGFVTPGVFGFNNGLFP